MEQRCARMRQWVQPHRPQARLQHRLEDNTLKLSLCSGSWVGKTPDTLFKRRLRAHPRRHAAQRLAEE
jgi:hypothetical protein